MAVSKKEAGHVYVGRQEEVCMWICVVKCMWSRYIYVLDQAG